MSIRYALPLDDPVDETIIQVLSAKEVERLQGAQMDDQRVIEDPTP